ncbi:MAG: exodeoxyribonuclease VII small subunit [Muribaculaceae bacterium]|jgi:exodeoxyribonuclease VII small subunit
MPDSIEELSYSQALAELEQIVATLRGNNCDIDRLTALTRRASELLLECRRRLTATEGELEQILAGLEAAAGE